MPGASEVPPFRPLRVFAFDPSLALQLKTLEIHEVAIRVPWERDAETGRINPGPIGEYLEVIDVDPASGVVYPPVELDDPNILAQDGLRPSEGNPQFHQQMVYAVAMATITHFERALGRVAEWAAHRPDAGKEGGDQWQVEFVRRLRIYPHALRDQNAYYSPDKKAVLFGYFPVRRKDAYNTPGTTVFTCLSHDIIARRSRMHCSTAFTPSSTSPAILMRSLSTRRSLTSSRSSSTSHIRASYATRSREHLEISTARTCSANLRSSSGKQPAAGPRYGMPDRQRARSRGARPDRRAARPRGDSRGRGVRSFFAHLSCQNARSFSYCVEWNGTAAERRTPSRPYEAACPGGVGGRSRHPTIMHPRPRLLSAGEYHFRPLSARHRDG